MKKLQDVLVGVEVQQIVGNENAEISSVVFDSRKADKDSLFVAIKGNKGDGSLYINSAIENGSRVIVCEEIHDIKPEVAYIVVSNARKALALIAQNFFNNPTTKLKLVGVTGTNGKTTTATLLYKLFMNLGYKCALISTVENKINNEVFPTDHTTPDPVTLAQFVDMAVSKGCQYAFMECSSHAIDQDRIDGMIFAGAIFTNLTLDHLDYHKTFDAYAHSKKRFFDMLDKSAFAVANIDDANAELMLSETKAKKHYISLKNKKADFGGGIVENNLKGLKIKIGEKCIESKLVGEFNAYNILGIYASVVLLGESSERVIEKFKDLSAPSGRLEFIESKSGVFGVVDYAHTPDALENVLKTLNETKSKSTQIITIVGCGGDRDKTKRPIMGGIATKLSDYTIFTSDNPRSENPEAILADITVGADSTRPLDVEVDRAKAIAKACARAKPGDIILVAGKGHEPYQIFKDKTVHFSDVEELHKNFGL